MSYVDADWVVAEFLRVSCISDPTKRMQKSRCLAESAVRDVGCDLPSPAGAHEQLSEPGRYDLLIL